MDDAEIELFITRTLQLVDDDELIRIMLGRDDKKALLARQVFDRKHRDDPKPAEPALVERHKLLHRIFDLCLALYLRDAPPPPGEDRTSIYDPLSRMIEHGRLLEHSVDELLQAYFRSGHSPDDPIADLMKWSHRQAGGQ